LVVVRALLSEQNVLLSWLKPHWVSTCKYCPDPLKETPQA